MNNVVPYILKRLLYFIPTMVAITLVIHLVLHFAGADPVRIMLGDSATEESIQFWTVKLGLDKPVLVQYWIWLKRFLLGDLGTSLTLAQDFSVFELIKQCLPMTDLLAATSISLALIVAIHAGMISTLRRRHVEDYTVTTGGRG